EELLHHVPEVADVGRNNDGDIAHTLLEPHRQFQVHDVERLSHELREGTLHRGHRVPRVEDSQHRVRGDGQRLLGRVEVHHNAGGLALVGVLQVESLATQQHEIRVRVDLEGDRAVPAVELPRVQGHSIL